MMCLRTVVQGINRSNHRDCGSVTRLYANEERAEGAGVDEWVGGGRWWRGFVSKGESFIQNEVNLFYWFLKINITVISS